MDVQNLEKNYRDFQFRVTHLDPVIEPEMHRQEKSRITSQAQKEPVISHGNNGYCYSIAQQLLTSVLMSDSYSDVMLTLVCKYFNSMI